jgi:murein L,D-transpeptidase YcbB/YkuD
MIQAKQGLSRAFLSFLFLLIFFAGAFAEAPHPQYPLLQQQLIRYQAIEKAGGWSKITSAKKFLMKGDSGPAIVALRRRLQATGDLAEGDTGTAFDEALTAAVKHIQVRFGFKPNGVVDAALLKELNVPVQKRLAQIRVNLDRVAKLPEPGPGTQLVANIPEFKLHVYEGSKVAWDMDIVVGSESNKTVLFNDEMTHIVFSPSWNVPPSIVRNEILPKIRETHEYLWRNNYVIEGEEGGLPKVRQLPGPKNSLGRVKFVFPNDHNIYFHDTPAKSLFSMRQRAFSHGCIRLAEPARLAEYLLRNSPTWTPEKIRAAMNSGKEQTVNLPAKIPVSLTYLTAWVDDNGLLHFREDIYDLDHTGS